MAWTQADIDALKAAIASGKGVRSVTFSDQRIEFASIDEMLKLLAVMQASITPSRMRLAATRKGV